MTDIRHTNITTENNTNNNNTTLSPNSSTSSASSSISSKLMSNSLNLFQNLIPTAVATQQQQQQQQSNSLYENYLKAAILQQQQQQQNSYNTPNTQQKTTTGATNGNNAIAAYDLAYRSLLQYNPVAAAAAACAAFYNTKETATTPGQPQQQQQQQKAVKNDNSYETVSPSISDVEDEDDIDENNNNNNNTEDDIKTDEKLEEGEIARNNINNDNIVIIKKQQRSSSVSSLSSTSSTISKKSLNTTNNNNNGDENKNNINKDTFEEMQKCLINDADNAIMQCFDQKIENNNNNNDDDEFIKQKENIPSSKIENEKKLSSSYKIESLLDSSKITPIVAGSTTTTIIQTPEVNGGGNKKVDFINTLKNEILIAVNNAIQKTFENFIKINYNNNNSHNVVASSALAATTTSIASSSTPQAVSIRHDSYESNDNATKRILKRNLIVNSTSTNIKPHKRQRLNDNPSSRSLYKNQKYLSRGTVNGGIIGSYETAFKPLGSSTINNKFSINQLTSASTAVVNKPASITPTTQQQPQQSVNAAAVAVNQLYAAAISHLQNQHQQQQPNSHHHHPAFNNHHTHHPAAAHLSHSQFFATNPYALAAANSNRLFTPYLMDNQNSNQNPLNLLTQSQQQQSQSQQQHHIFHTPIKRRRTKVTDTRLSPRTSATINQQLANKTSSLLNNNNLVQSPSSQLNDDINAEYADDDTTNNNNNNNNMNNGEDSYGGGDDFCDDEQQQQQSNIYDDNNNNNNENDDDEDKQQSIHSTTNDGLLNSIYNDNNDNMDDIMSNGTQANEYIGYQISFLTNKKSYTSTLSSLHLRKAKLMFFFTRYPSSTILRNFFPDVKFNKANTAQLVKWFSNFREFFYIQIEKYARQYIAEGVKSYSDFHINFDSEIFRVLNLHYNRNNQIEIPQSFCRVIEATLKEFFKSIQEYKDQDPSWKKAIYKVIARMDDLLPEYFKSVKWMESLETHI